MEGHHVLGTCGPCNQHGQRWGAAVDTCSLLPHLPSSCPNTLEMGGDVTWSRAAEHCHAH